MCFNLYRNTQVCENNTALNLSVLLQLTVKLTNVLTVSMLNVFQFVLEHKFVKIMLVTDCEADKCLDCVNAKCV